MSMARMPLRILLTAFPFRRLNYWPQKLDKSKARHVVLTGGKTIQFFYSRLSDSLARCSASFDMNFYIGDERCVPFGHPDSNYGMIMETLFRGELPESSIFHRIETEGEDLALAAENYSNLLPESVDVLLLSMGEDGHIASLFPGSPALLETERKVLHVVGPKEPLQRITITPPVIQAAKQVYVLAIGEKKRRKYEEALEDPSNISAIPARLVLNRTWIFDLDEEIDLCPKR